MSQSEHGDQQRILDGRSRWKQNKGTEHHKHSGSKSSHQLRALGSLAHDLTDLKGTIVSLVSQFVLPLLNSDCAAFIVPSDEYHTPNILALYSNSGISAELNSHAALDLLKYARELLDESTLWTGEGGNSFPNVQIKSGVDGSSILMAVINHRGRCIGIFSACVTSTEGFDDNDESFLAACAALVSSTLSTYTTLCNNWPCVKLTDTKECGVLTDLIVETAVGLSVDLICAVDTNMAVTYFNGAYDDCFYKHHGVRLAVGQKIGDILTNSPDRERIVSSWHRVLTTGMTVHERRDIVHDGVEEVYATSISPLRGKNREVCGAVMLLRDITDHITVARQVKRSQELLQKSQQIARLGSWEMDFTSGKLSWSDEMYDLLCISRSTVSPSFDYILQSCHYHDRATLENAVASAKSTGQPWSIDFRLKTPDGVRWFCSMGSPVVGSEGHIARFEGVLMDITARKTAELHADKVHKQFVQFMDNPSILAWITTVDTEIHYINEPYARMFGLTASELVGKNGYDMFPEHQLKAIIDHNKMVAATGTSHEMEESLTRPDGTLGTYLVQKFPITSDSDEVLVGGIAIDVTSQRQLQAELLQSQKMDGIGRLAGGIAHDFNNLLSVILGYAELVQESLDPVEVQAGVAQIQKAAHRAAALTNQLLSFARKQIVSPTLVEVADVIENTFSMLKPLIGDNITFTVEIVPHEGRVLIDSNQFEQVVVNLVVNARDSIVGHGTVKITARPDYYDEPFRHPSFEIAAGDYTRVEVTDSGGGMSPETISHAFEPFYTTKPNGKGTGLGLATVYGIIKQNRGYVWLDSVPGLGTTATILLPLTYNADVLNALPAPVANRAGNEVIMVVEDEHVLRVLTVNALTVRGYKVLEASNGREALSIVSDRTVRIDLLITDSNMPEMGGIELVRNLRSLRPELPVIISTGYSQEMTAASDDVPGDIEFLLKPYTMAKLADKVSEVLHHRAK